MIDAAVKHGILVAVIVLITTILGLALATNIPVQMIPISKCEPSRYRLAGLARRHKM